MEKHTKTIKDAFISDFVYIGKIQEKEGLSVAGALHKVITEAENNQAGSAENTRLLQENERLTKLTESLQQENQKVNEVNNELTLQVEELINRPPEIKEVDKPVEVIKEVGLQLPEGSVVYTPSKETATRMRKLSLFIKTKKDFSVIKDHENFVNELCDKAVSKFIMYHYEEIF